MKKIPTGEKVILALTTCAALAWAVWLVRYTSGSVFSQDGILRFFPVVPLAFIYLYIYSRASAENPDEENAAHDGSNEQSGVTVEEDS